MFQLRPDTKAKLEKLFSKEHRDLAEKLLSTGCSEVTVHSKIDIERVRQGILKLSKGDIEELKKTIEWAKIDWRDILVAAKFEKPNAYMKWKP